MTAQNGTDFRWTAVREKAAVLVSEDKQTDQEIADSLGIGRRTLAAWKLAPEFRARVKEHLDALRERLKLEGIAVRAHRIEALNDRQRRLQQVIAERAAHMSYQDVPGGSTGLIVRTEKHMGKVTVVEYAVDTGLLKELREHEKQAAQEVGEWTEKRDVTSDGKPVQPQTFTILIDRREEDDASSDD